MYCSIRSFRSRLQLDGYATHDVPAVYMRWIDSCNHDIFTSLNILSFQKKVIKKCFENRFQSQFRKVPSWLRSNYQLTDRLDHWTYLHRTADRQIRILPSGYYTWAEEGKANLYLYDSYSYWWMWVLIPLPVFFFMPTRPKKSQMSEEGYSKARNRIYMSGHSFFQRGLLMLIPEESSSPATIGDICDQPRPRITSFTRS